jgi:1-acyl-sn-glycerol-3-phosphate acyltransferase
VLYYFLKILTSIFYRVFYSIEEKNAEKVNSIKGAVVLAPNHSNAFIDPIIVGILLKQKVRFFARGDVFKSNFSKWILNILNVSPIYRMSEGGISAVKKNDATIEECKMRIARKETIMLFPEGICIQQKRITPLRKGLAKIVFAAAEETDFNDEIMIVPVGINYTAASKFRSKVLIEFGDTISIKNYKEKYVADKARTINEFTAQLQPKLEEVNIVINQTENEKLAEEIVEIRRHDFISNRFPFKTIKATDEVMLWRNVAKKINELATSNTELFEKLRNGVNTYIAELHRMNLRDHLFRKENVERTNIFSVFIELFFVFVFLPLYWVGVFFNYPPYYIAKKIADKKAKQKEFYASVYCNAAMLLWLLWQMACVITFLLITHSSIGAIIFAMSFKLTGIFAIRFLPVMKKAFGRLRLLNYVRKQREKIEDMFLMREMIIDLLNNNKF